VTYTGAGIGAAWMMLIGTVAARSTSGPDWPSGAAAGDVLFTGRFGAADPVMLGSLDRRLNFYGSR